ncbi:sulfotransferase [Erythrobacter sp. sf7]|uniref:Sulfotransferase n=1 Tax=Erythrobacter fulvus TaxID=2987523 RepID=A0ABT5JN23_9SPHN|nr:sulfotransferase [Erythrobacter fulvus]
MANTMPHFIIIGAMKSATSTLHVQLSRQLGFWMSEPKEPNFFSDDDVWTKGLGWYSALFEGAAPSDLRGESSTHYTKLPDYPEALARMREHVPDAKLIYIMRHPIDRLVSHYMHAWLEASMEGDINQAVERYPALVNYGRYTMQLQPFLETYGPDNVLPVFFERLTKHPQEELERVCAFLGYEGVPIWSEEESRQNVSTERLRVDPLRDRIVNYPPIKFVRQKMIPRSVRNRVKQAWQITEKPELSLPVRRALMATFDQDLQTLGEWLGADLDCLTFKEAVRAKPLNWTKAAPFQDQWTLSPAT